MRAVVRSITAVALALGAVLALPHHAAACLAYSDPIDTADFDGPPRIALLATATGGPPSDDPFGFTQVLRLRGGPVRGLNLGPGDSWSCHPPTFRRGDRVLILSWGRLPNVGLPLVWRVGPAGEIFPGVGFTPRLEGHEPMTLAEILNRFGIDIPDSAVSPPVGRPATPIGLALIGVAFALVVRRRRRPAR
jgi:MYXO-CTERM domain-containing protein